MKKETSTLLKKLKGYSGLTGSLLALANISGAQVVYTDVDPDFTDSDNGASYSLDLNNDAVADFMINVHTNGADGVRLLATALDDNAIAGSSAPPYKYPSAFGDGELIGPALSWVPGSYQTMASEGYFQGAYGEWFGATDEFLGLRIEVGSNTHYGWARLDVSDDGHTFTVKDYAYEATSDETILTGEGGQTAIDEASAVNFNVFVVDRQLHLQMKNIPEGFIGISNAAGQKILDREISNSIEVLDLSAQPAGLYLVSIIQNESIITRKVALH